MALFSGVCLLRGVSSFRRILRSYGFTYLPLTFAGHIAFHIPFMKEGLNWVTGNLPSGGHPGQGLHPYQALLLLLGFLWSLLCLKNLYRREDRFVSIVHGILILLFGVLLFFAL